MVPSILKTTQRTCELSIMSSKLAIAILGARIFVREGLSLLLVNLILEHLPAIEKSGLYDVKAVYSRSKKSAKAFIPDGSLDIYSDDSGPGRSLEDLLARKAIHAVDVVLPITH
jgi:predicted dehydrogenase